MRGPPVPHLLLDYRPGSTDVGTSTRRACQKRWPRPGSSWIQRPGRVTVLLRDDGRVATGEDAIEIAVGMVPGQGRFARGGQSARCSRR